MQQKNHGPKILLFSLLTLIVSLKSSFEAISYYMDRIAKFVNQFSHILDRKCFLIIFSLLRVSSQDATVTGIVENILNAISMFG